MFPTKIKQVLVDDFRNIIILQVLLDSAQARMGKNLRNKHVNISPFRFPFPLKQIMIILTFLLLLLFYVVKKTKPKVTHISYSSIEQICEFNLIVFQTTTIRAFYSGKRSMNPKKRKSIVPKHGDAVEAVNHEQYLNDTTVTMNHCQNGIVSTIVINNRIEELDIANFSLNYLESLHNEDPFMYYSILDFVRQWFLSRTWIIPT